jgi:hypothetical protein
MVIPYSIAPLIDILFAIASIVRSRISSPKRRNHIVRTPRQPDERLHHQSISFITDTGDPSSNTSGLVSLVDGHCDKLSNGV